MRSFLQSFGHALQNVRANLFHTFLSVLGIVIGVAALVATFSLIDGLEKFARDKISDSTSLNMVVIQTQTEKSINNLLVRKDTFQVIDYERYRRIKAFAPALHRSMLDNHFNREIQVPGRDSGIGARLRCLSEAPFGDTALLQGRNFSPQAFDQREPVALVNDKLARLLAGSDDLTGVPGMSFSALGHRLRIEGVFKAEDPMDPPIACIPISILSNADLHRSPPQVYLQTSKTEDVKPLKEKVQAWLKQEFGAQSTDFEVFSRDFWVGETEKGFLVFRIVMGLIIGISVVVGGVGVMNVLLISVNERTAEIGLRKSVGAKKSDIRSLFLAESIAVSAFGSFLGLLLGIGFAKLAIVVIRLFAEVPFSAVLTWNTFFIISIVAVLVGILFGTYPAVKAARLDPVEALRRE